MHCDADRWNARYAGRFGSWPRPPEGLDDGDAPSSGRCLDIACGLGEQSVWAARRGLHVVAVDVSDVAVAATIELAQTYGVAERVDARVHDLDQGLGVLGGDPGFDLVICQRFRAPSMYGEIARAVAPSGWLAITVLSEVDNEPGEFRAPPGELMRAFHDSGLHVSSHVEAHGEATLIAQRRVDAAV